MDKHVKVTLEQIVTTVYVLGEVYLAGDPNIQSSVVHVLVHMSKHLSPEMMQDVVPDLYRDMLGERRERKDQ